MATNCNHDHDKRDGTGQGRRFLPALDTTGALLDDRSVEDILVFAKHYADLVRFYDMDETVDWNKPTAAETQPPAGPAAQQKEGATPAPESRPVTTWKEFFYSDIAVVVASVAQYKGKLGELNQTYTDLRHRVDKDPTRHHYDALFTNILGHLQRLGRWHTRSMGDHPLKAELELKIGSVLKPFLEKLIAYDKGAAVLHDGTADEDDTFEGARYKRYAAAPWNIDASKIKAIKDIYEGATPALKIAHAALYIDDIFQTVLKVYKDLTERSEFYFTAAIEQYPEHQPHMALFIAFARLFTHARDEFNGLARRHLEFYYRDVLRLKEKPARPDAVYMLYELAKEVAEYNLELGTALFAGKDATGKDLIYKTDAGLVVNQGRVKELKTLFLDKQADAAVAGPVTESSYIIKSLQAAPVARSADGNGLPFKVPETSWPTFGFFKEGQPPVGAEASVGFAIASPQLFLAEGTRLITVSVPFQGANTVFNTLGGALEIHLSGAKGWINVTDWVGDAAQVPGQLCYSIDDNEIKVNIPQSAPPVVAYDEAVHGENFNTRFPLMKFWIKKSSGYNALRDALIDFQSEGFRIDVTVAGVKDLILFGDTPLDPAKPFHPFSFDPKPGAQLTIGSQEVFTKRLNTLTLHVNRKASEMVYADLLAGEGLGRTLLVDAERYHERRWEMVSPSGTFGYDFFAPSIAITGLGHIGRSKDPAGEFGLTDGSTGFLRVNLHADYDMSGAVDAHLARYIGSTWPRHPDTVFYSVLLKQSLETQVRIKQALLALLETKDISLDYTSEQGFEPGTEQFFHLYPFGAVEVWLDQLLAKDGSLHPQRVAQFSGYDNRADRLVIATPYLLPQFRFGQNAAIRQKYAAWNDSLPSRLVKLFHVNQYDSLVHQQGHLFIGIENLVPPQNLSLLFKMADGTAEDNDFDPPAIHWSYLVNNEWRPLPDDHIVSDSTYGLQTTGIVLIDFPADATSNNTLLTTGLHWLCASVDNHATRIPRLIDVIAQANRAVFFDQQNDPQHYRAPLPAETISKLLVKVPEIKSVRQPFESFDGALREEGNVFYARASERLRHKNRAITPWDYEHLVLEQFPGVYKVKALSHTDPECLCRHTRNTQAECCCAQVAPGHVMIVPVSNLRNKNAVDILKPRTSRRTLLQIEAYLKNLTSPFVHVHARNPLFEEVKTYFRVKFHTGTDKGYFLKKLNNDLVRFLTPWAFDETEDIVFGGKVYASHIINFIEERSYVDYITCFRMIHIVDGCCADDTLVELNCDEIAALNAASGKSLSRLETEIEASSPRAILTSVKNHCIELIDEPAPDDDCHCVEP